MTYEYVLGCEEVVRHGGVDTVLAKLGGISHEELARQVSRFIETSKKMSPPGDFWINISAPDDKYQTVPEGMHMISVLISA